MSCPTLNDYVCRTKDIWFHSETLTCPANIRPAHDLCWTCFLHIMIDIDGHDVTMSTRDIKNRYFLLLHNIAQQLHLRWGGTTWMHSATKAFQGHPRPAIALCTVNLRRKLWGRSLHRGPRPGRTSMRCSAGQRGNIRNAGEVMASPTADYNFKLKGVWTNANQLYHANSLVCVGIVGCFPHCLGISMNQCISALSNRKRFSKGRVTRDILRFKLAGCRFWGRRLCFEHVQPSPFDVLHGQVRSSHIIWANDPTGTATFVQAACVAHSNNFNVQSPQGTSTCSPEGQSGHTWHRPRQSQHYSMPLTHLEPAQIAQFKTSG